MARNVGDGSVLVESPDPGSEEDGPDQAADPAQVVDHSAAGEVHVTIDRQPALGGPDPVSHHRVDDGGDDGAGQ